jgi:hypothetical protein
MIHLDTSLNKARGFYLTPKGKITFQELSELIAQDVEDFAQSLDAAELYCVSS